VSSLHGTATVPAAAAQALPGVGAGGFLPGVSVTALLLMSVVALAVNRIAALLNRTPRAIEDDGIVVE